MTLDSVSVANLDEENLDSVTVSVANLEEVNMSDMVRSGANISEFTSLAPALGRGAPQSSSLINKALTA